MKENSIEEDIKILRESIIKEKYHIYNKDLKIILEHILSDYKRVLEINEVLLKENEELHKETDRMKSLDIHKLVEDWETGQLIPIQKIKDKIEYLDNQQKQWLEDRKLKVSDGEIIFAKDILKELLGKE